MHIIKFHSAVFGVLVDACHKQGSLMRGRLRAKRTSTLGAINYFTVEIIDNTSPVINAKARHQSQFLPTPPAFDAPVRSIHVRILP